MNIFDLLPDYEKYLLYERGLRPATVTNYLCDLRLYGLQESRPVREITLNDLRAYQRSLAEGGKHPVTIRKKIYGLSTFWEWLKMEGQVEDILPRLLTLPRKRESPPKFIQPDELIRFAETPDNHPDPYVAQRNSLCWLTMAWLGLRRGELLNLNAKDVHLGLINTVTIWDSKSIDYRSLPLLPKIQMAYQGWVGKIGREQNVFALQMGTRWSKQAFMNAFQNHLIYCNLGGRGITPHTIRHSVATMLLAQGIDIVIISKVLGHKDIQTTMRYLRVVPNQITLALSKHMLNQT